DQGKQGKATSEHQHLLPTSLRAAARADHAPGATYLGNKLPSASRHASTRVCATPVESIAEYVPGWSRWRATCSLRGVGTRPRAWLGDTWRGIRALPELDSALAGVAGGAAMAAYLVLAMWGAAEGPLAALRAIGSGHPLGGG